MGVESILRNIHDYHEAKNATIILVSHSMEEVARTVDRLVVVSGGRIMQRPARNEHLVAPDVDPRPQRPELGIDRFGPIALLLSLYEVILSFILFDRYSPPDDR